jgi:urease accessory protein
VDFWAFVIDVSGGGDIPRKRGPGVLRADVLIINKADLAPHVGVDLELMIAEAREVRRGKPVFVTNCSTGEGVAEVARFISDEVLF